MSNLILNSSIEKFTRMMFSRVIERLAVVMSEEHLSFSQVAALHIIDQEKSISIQDISLRLNLSLSATSRLVDELVKTELLDRVEDQENRRSKILTLTPQGQDFLNKLSIERVKIIKSTAESLPQKLSSKFLGAISSKKGNKT
jgi:DNA-binding MarR family transcriptional regulator